MNIKGHKYISKNFKIKRVVGKRESYSFDVKLQGSIDLSHAFNKYRGSSFTEIYFMGEGAFIEFRPEEGIGFYQIGTKIGGEE